MIKLFQIRAKMKHLITLVPVFVFLLVSGFVKGKECTNSPTQLSSHTFRNELLKSKNETLKKELFSHYHLTPTDEFAWVKLLPRKVLKEDDDEFSWTMMYRKMKNTDAPGDFLKEISLHNVRLDPDTVHGKAQATNLEYLLMLDVDSMAWSFRKTAGLDTPGNTYGGWEDPTGELRGHFVGHYLSATAQMWASTHNDMLKEKMSALVSALKVCQDKMGSGYLSAFPSEEFDRYEAIKPVWAPYYTIHKIMAGLLDQYTFADNAQALEMVKKMADYFYNRVQNVIKKYTIERHWTSLNEETGGMNDILYKLYVVTRDSKYLLLGHLFDKPCFLGLLAIQAEDISGFHSNTHIPVVIGSQMRYEITGDPLYKEMGMFFMNIVNNSHSYATGGTSFNEFWTDPKRLADKLQTENEESCTTYNMLKVSRHLFRWTKETAYADYYERALTNGVLGIQRGTDPGVMIYMLPLGRGVSKAVSYHGWGTKYDSFWCCYGTGIESFSKLGDSIYFEDEKAPGLYIIQYISSSVDWKSGKIFLNQKVDPVLSTDPFLWVTFTISSKEGSGQSSTLNLRVPVWTQSKGAKAVLNAESLSIPPPGNFLHVTRKWNDGDKLTLQLPLELRIEAIKDDRPEYASVHAILYGPYLLAGHSNGDWDLKTGSSSSLSDWITPIPPSYNKYLVTFTQEIGQYNFALKNTDQSITMGNLPLSGSMTAAHTTFRLVSSELSTKLSSPEDLIGKTIELEPFNHPGMTIIHDEDYNLTIGYSLAKGSSEFVLVNGLDGKSGSVSLELKSRKGCFIYNGLNYNGETKLGCESKSNDKFSQSASFQMTKGISEYHPISFSAKGVKTNFLLQPLFSFVDETYTVYFNLQD